MSKKTENTCMLEEEKREKKAKERKRKNSKKSNEWLNYSLEEENSTVEGPKEDITWMLINVAINVPQERLLCCVVLEMTS